MQKGDLYLAATCMLNAELNMPWHVRMSLLSALFVAFWLIKKAPESGENSRSAMEFVILFALNQNSFDHL